MTTEMTHNLSFLTLILNASPLAQGVLVLLLIASLMSWWTIFRKMFSIRHAIKHTNAFEDEFWSGTDLQNLYQRTMAGQQPVMGMEKIFEAGFREFLKLKRQGRLDNTAIMEGTRRAIKAAYQRELDYLESGLAFLASVGSVSPYVGLFGTVWGIMNAFRGLSNVVQATLAQVAPGIAEALIATAMGLFAAIPAVLAYNNYSHEIDRLGTRFESFIEEFSNILQRQAVSQTP